MQTGEVEGCTSTEVLQEILYRYVGLRRPDLALEVYDLFVGLCSTVFPVTLADTDRALSRQLTELLELIRQYGPEAVAGAIEKASAAHAFGADYVANCRATGQKPFLDGPAPSGCRGLHRIAVSVAMNSTLQR